MTGSVGRRNHKSPLIWFSLITGLLYFTHNWRLTGPPEDVNSIEYITDVLQGGNPARVALFTLLGIGGFVAAIRTRRGIQSFWFTVPGLLTAMLFSWSALSILWSMEPETSVRRLSVMVLFFLGALGVATRWHPIVILRFMVFFGVLNLGISTLAATLNEGFSVFSPGYRFGGNFHPNPQGQACALLFLASLGLSKSGPRFPNLLRVVAIISFTFLILTKSRTALAGAIFGLVIYWYYTLSRPRKWQLALLFVMVLLIAALIGWEVTSEFVLLGRDRQTAQSLTGRLPLWRVCLSYAEARPFAGYGFDAFWTETHIEEISLTEDWTISETHSAYLNLLLTTGIVGLMLYLSLFAGLLHSAHDIFKLEPSPVAAISIGITACFLVFGFLESVTLFTPNVHFFPALALIISQVVRKNFLLAGAS